MRDIGGDDNDDDDDDTAVVPARIPTNISSDDDFNSSDDESLSSYVAQVSRARPNNIVPGVRKHIGKRKVWGIRASLPVYASCA